MKNKINWKKLAQKMPKSFKCGRSIFKVNFIDKFEDPKQVGMSDWNNNCIYIKSRQNAKETVLTYLHEITHIFSDEFEIKLSEKQVGLIEKHLHFLLFKDNIFK